MAFPKSVDIILLHVLRHMLSNFKIK